VTTEDGAMDNLLKLALVALAVGTPFAAQGQSHRFVRGPAPAEAIFDPFGPYGGRAPWSPPWVYDTGSDNDDIPSRPRYQQGGGTQTGGPARNLLPSDGLHIVPR
jgi:hypothetical protein